MMRDVARHPIEQRNSAHETIFVVIAAAFDEFTQALRPSLASRTPARAMR